MGFITVGNLLTIGIVLLILILYRQMDRNSRNLKMLRDYSEKLKKEISSHVEAQEHAIKDYAISLNVERDAAKELMKHLQFTEEELAEKAAMVARIDAQLRNYETSLAELDRMTGRVQENMMRVRDESAFVEAAGKRIADSKTRLEDLEKGLLDLENRFERENNEALEKTAGEVLSSVRSDISDLGATAETIERRVEEHRDAIGKIEEKRAADMARNMEQIDAVFKNAMEQAGNKANKMEENALTSLKEQAEERLLKLKAAEEEKLLNYQESAKARVAEVHGMVKNIRDEWRAEREDWEAKDNAYRDERKKDIHEINMLVTDSEKRNNSSLAAMEKQVEELSSKTSGMVSAQETTFRTMFADSEKHFVSELAAAEKRMEDLLGRANELVASQEVLLVKAAEDMKRKALETTGEKLEEYRRAQDAEFKRLETLADDSRNLDAELRRNMQEVAGRIREEFSRFEHASADLQKGESDKFSSSAALLKKEMAEVESELAALKETAHENVSDKLKLFEDNFFADLTSRSTEIDKRFLEWQENLEDRLSGMDEAAATERQELERSITEQMKKNLSAQDERLTSELDHLKSETMAFEEGIQGHMHVADESVASLKEQLDLSLDEARKEAEVFIRSEISKHSSTAAETIKQYQRELDGKLREMSDYINARNGEITELINVSRSDFEKAQGGLEQKIRELDGTVEEARLRLRDLAAETDNRISSVRSLVDDAERHIREAVDQTKLIDRADELRLDMEHRIEDLKGDIDRLDQRRAEAFQLENDFVKIRRLEDDVNAKMTRFLSEKRRIETMEADFNRLLQISRSVEEKLTQVTVSDDTLQAMQLQIRKLEEALTATEDKYQRVERKSQIIDNTNDGIDRNFKILQDSEKQSQKIGNDLKRSTEDLESIKGAIEKLAGESERAREASERIDVLTGILEEVEERIQSMQRARQWIANAETRLEELNKDILVQLRATESAAKDKKGGRPRPLDPDHGEGAPSQEVKENVIALARRGWKVDEIAKNMKISRGLVELILEMAPKD